MSRKDFVLAAIALVGVGCVIAGVLLWLGLAAALIVGGVAAVVFALMVDAG